MVNAVSLLSVAFGVINDDDDDIFTSRLLARTAVDVGRRVYCQPARFSDLFSYSAVRPQVWNKLSVQCLLVRVAHLDLLNGWSSCEIGTLDLRLAQFEVNCR